MTTSGQSNLTFLQTDRLMDSSLCRTLVVGGINTKCYLLRIRNTAVTLVR